ncbi:hypothetical protein MPTK1_1g06370 [Marchantia polymorpha subsp. ruderalis]|uniref:Uncharacterized protein n=2 Tax=Marchantia polymorpha TaxID=3197 RepID=A0AAF6AM55_MARPO|nr:hypothetical protein MARPO_0043s0029 [Marchantia polymorpha]PTQ39765.1 hypothetical protein MARPO_0043s0029 [Marchantia polymorpha]BBM97525.1 hypothetical protein Mp_1g06370 [Marchantia polymorpha subsp. ruderalis]BBM97526.1 hypothetical protein Mp_1g06370 [Marchantia polymorpha subsp. ruderalis]|eukprot:PTQ39764.1 hypothetical protein MARPO_0043s0029 [Marchantia polymorpha]
MCRVSLMTLHAYKTGSHVLLSSGECSEISILHSVRPLVENALLLNTAPVRNTLRTFCYMLGGKNSSNRDQKYSLLSHTTVDTNILIFRSCEKVPYDNVFPVDFAPFAFLASFGCNRPRLERDITVAFKQLPRVLSLVLLQSCLPLPAFFPLDAAYGNTKSVY